VLVGAAAPAALGRLEVLGEPQPLDLPPTSTRMVTVRVRADAGARGVQPIEFLLMPEEEDAKPFTLREKSRFLLP
jgi:hypothetical protein